MTSVLRRIGFVTTGAITGTITGFFGFTAAYSTYETIVNGDDVQELDMDFEKGLMTEREMAIMNILDFTTTGCGIGGGVVGWKLCNNPTFSFPRLLKFSVGGILAGGVFTTASLIATSYLLSPPEDEVAISSPTDNNANDDK